MPVRYFALKNNNNNIEIYTAPFAKGYKALALLLLIITLVIGSHSIDKPASATFSAPWGVYLVMLHCAQTNSFNATTSYQVPIYTPGWRETNVGKVPCPRTQSVCTARGSNLRSLGWEPEALPLRQPLPQKQHSIQLKTKILLALLF